MIKSCPANSPVYSIKPWFKHCLASLETLVLAVVVTLQSTSLLAQGTTSDSQAEKVLPGQMPYFDAVPDPLEGFNRSSWGVNVFLFRDVLYPFSFAYNFVVPKPLRSGIGNAGHNLTYPVRLVNNCLQGNGTGRGKKPSASARIPPLDWAAFLIRRPS